VVRRATLEGLGCQRLLEGLQDGLAHKPRAASNRPAPQPDFLAV
jgi:hypothetical protein